MNLLPLKKITILLGLFLFILLNYKIYILQQIDVTLIRRALTEIVLILFRVLP